MTLKDIVYSYPIHMSGRDDIGTLHVPVSYRIDKNAQFYSIHLNFTETNPGILNYISNGDAVFACEIDCPATYYRECITNANPTFSIKLNKHQILGRVKFKCYIVAVNSIQNYQVDEMNEQYQGFVINLDPGDVLGYFGSFVLDADINYELLNQVSTFMEIKEAPYRQKIHFDLSGEKIIIEMPSDLFKSYKDNISGDRFAHIVHSSLVYNALMYALYNYNEFWDRKWARVIKNRVEIEPNLQAYRNLEDLDNVPDLADELLQNPYKRLFTNLIDITNNGD